MEVVYRRVAGLDIAKSEVVACIRTPAGGQRFKQETTTWPAMTGSLLELKQRLVEAKVELVVMEATGDYWKPVYYVLEEVCEVWLVNAAHVKNVKGRKTDVKDAEWLAKLAQHGLVRPSFVPPEPIRRLRDLTRQRTHLIGERTRAVNRLEKVLEDAGIKTSLVMSKTLTTSGRLMLQALIGGERDPLVLADLAIGRARTKIPDLRRALVGRFGDHHAFLAQAALDHVDTLDTQIDHFTGRIEAELRPFSRKAALLCTIPGVADRIASIIVAETGGDMSRFPTPQALCSWAGVAPGNNKSGGKTMAASVTPGNTYLKGALGDAAAAASRTKHTYLSAFYRRIARRRGRKRALVAVMRKILVSVWHMLTNDVEYHDLGPGYYDHHPSRARHRTRRLLNELAALGVDITPLAHATAAGQHPQPPPTAPAIPHHRSLPRRG